MVAPGGHAWLLWGGTHGCSQGEGACVVALGVGACMVAPGGACMVAPGGGVHGCSGGMCGCSGGMCGCSGGMCGFSWRGHAWDMTRYGDTINERAVRILLECILVSNILTPALN